MSVGRKAPPGRLAARAGLRASSGGTARSGRSVSCAPTGAKGVGAGAAGEPFAAECPNTPLDRPSALPYA